MSCLPLYTNPSRDSRNFLLKKYPYLLYIIYLSNNLLQVVQCPEAEFYTGLDKAKEELNPTLEAAKLVLN